MRSDILLIVILVTHFGVFEASRRPAFHDHSVLNSALIHGILAFRLEVGELVGRQVSNHRRQRLVSEVTFFLNLSHRSVNLIVVASLLALESEVLDLEILLIRRTVGGTLEASRLTDLDILGAVWHQLMRPPDRRANSGLIIRVDACHCVEIGFDGARIEAM